MITTAIVIAGGRGSRLAPITDHIPKAMVSINGKPIIQRIVEWLAKNGIKKVVMGVAHKKELLISFLGDGKRFGLDIVYSHHSELEETAHPFKEAIKNGKVTDEHFFAMNGDQITELDLQELGRYHIKHGAHATLTILPTKFPYGLVRLHPDMSVHSFLYKPLLKDVLMNAGIFVFSQKIVPYILATTKGTIDDEVFAPLAREGKLKAYYYEGFFSTVNTPYDLDEAEKILKEREGVE